MTSAIKQPGATWPNPSSSTVSTSGATNAAATMAATIRAACNASPSWLTLAAAWARSAARAGSAGQVIANPSQKIWAPTCSDTTRPFSSAEPDSGASTPARRRRYAVCSVEFPRPPHQRTVRSGISSFSQVRATARGSSGPSVGTSSSTRGNTRVPPMSSSVTTSRWLFSGRSARSLT